MQPVPGLVVPDRLPQGPGEETAAHRIGEPTHRWHLPVVAGADHQVGAALSPGLQKSGDLDRVVLSVAV